MDGSKKQLSQVISAESLTEGSQSPHLGSRIAIPIPQPPNVPMSISLELLIIAALILANGFFAAAECLGDTLAVSLSEHGGYYAASVHTDGTVAFWGHPRHGALLVLQPPNHARCRARQ